MIPDNVGFQFTIPNVGRNHDSDEHATILQSAIKANFREKVTAEERCVDRFGSAYFVLAVERDFCHRRINTDSGQSEKFQADVNRITADHRTTMGHYRPHLSPEN
jgi:hypothetical protein